MSDPLRIRAAVLRRMGGPLTVEELLLEPPRAGEVLVRVAAAGVCHSDLHLAEGHLGTQRQPIVLGHEGAGVVEAIGEGVAHVRPGDRVGFCFVPACGACGQCRAGRTNLCRHYYTLGLHSGPWRIPAGRYFMLGDNTQDSSDSREWRFVVYGVTRADGTTERVRGNWRDRENPRSVAHGEPDGPLTLLVDLFTDAAPPSTETTPADPMGQAQAKARSGTLLRTGALRRRSAAEIKVMSRPTGSGSMNV